jgi:hypothetical protein
MKKQSAKKKYIQQPDNVEVKFEAWSETDKKMYTHDPQCVGEFLSAAIGNKWKLRWYIGIKDKNGKELYTHHLSSLFLRR